MPAGNGSGSEAEVGEAGQILPRMISLSMMKLTRHTLEDVTRLKVAGRRVQRFVWHQADGSLTQRSLHANRSVATGSKKERRVGKSQDIVISTLATADSGRFLALLRNLCHSDGESIKRRR